MGLKTFFDKLLGKKEEDTTPDLRYADPSHDKATWKKPEAAATQSAVPSKHRSHHTTPRKILAYLKTREDLQDINTQIIKEASPNGIKNNHLNTAILQCVLQEPYAIDMGLRTRAVTDYLHNSVRKPLIDKGIIGFSKKQGVWFLQKDHSRPLSARERNYLKANNISPDGWINIPNEISAIKWIKQNFDAEIDFEPFCCSVLEHTGARNAYQSVKRKSGADGGYDGICTFNINGDSEECLIQAKMYGLNKYIGEETCHHMIGVMHRYDLKYGFLITTGIFSDRAKEAIQHANEKGLFHIELIDQTRLIEALLITGNKPHGLGLLTTEKGYVYMNKDMLWQATKR
ncbi:MAG: restriction endonuclease [Pseudomonadota bacterium]|nr:restriction endonuclease [Pseudomonadota bacterium]